MSKPQIIEIIDFLLETDEIGETLEQTEALIIELKAFADKLCKNGREEEEAA